MMDGSDGDEDDSADEVQVKLVNRNGFSRIQNTEGDAGDLDFDPILGYKAHRGSHDPSLPEGQGDAAPHETGKFEVDLPDKLLCVLAISPSKVRDWKE